MAAERRPGPRCLSCGWVLAATDPVCPDCGEPTGPPERKVLTLLFADLSGYTEMCSRLDPEQVFDVMRPAMTSLRRVVERFGGTVPQIVGDGFMAVFGAPAAHEDDPERAVRAGQALQDRLAEINSAGTPLPPLRVGVETGEVFVAASRETAGFSVSGSTVNLASRLCDLAAPGRCLVGPKAVSLTEHVLAYSGSRRRRVKGLAEPVVVRELVATARPLRARSRPRRARFVGREAELRSLAAAAAEVVETRRSAAVLVVGEAGQGKSRLAEEYTAASPVTTLVGRCSSYAETHPLAPVVDAVSGLLDLSPSALDGLGEEALVERLEEIGAGDARRLASAVRRLIGADRPGRADAADDEVRAVRAVVESLAANGPVVLVLDDLQWAHVELVDLVRDVAAGEWAGPVLVLGLARADLDVDDARRVPLSPLSADDMTALLGDLLDVGLPPSAADQLLSRAGGNPLFLGECVRLLVERGSLVVADDGSVSIDAQHLREIPSSMRMFIAARLDALPLPEKALLQEASVLGERVWDAALPAAAASREALAGLVERGLLRPAAVSLVPGVTEYTFSHALIREVAYESVAHRIRSARHAAAAEWLVQAEAGGGGFRAPVALLAHHYHQAFLLGRDEPGGDGPCDLARAAVRYLSLWGDELWSSRARPAEVAYASALGVARAAPQCIARDDRARLHVQHARTCVELGRYVDADDDARMALALAPAAEAPVLYVSAQLVRVQTMRYRGDVGDAARLLDALTPVAEAAASPQVTAELMLERARVQRYADYPRLPWLLRDAYAACVAAGDEAGRYEIAHELAYVQTMEGGADFERWYETAESLTAHDDVRGAARLGRVSASVALLRGDYDRATSEAVAAELLATEGGFHLVEADTLIVRLSAAAQTGRLAEGEALLQQLLHLSQRHGWQRVPAVGLAAGARLAARRRDATRAHERLAEARRRFDQVGARFERLDVDIAEVDVLDDTGHWQRASEVAGQVVDALEPPGWGLYALGARVTGARAALGHGDEAAAALLAGAVDAARRHAVPVWGALAAASLEQAQLLGGASASTRLDAPGDTTAVRAVAAENDGVRAWLAGDAHEAASWFAAAVEHWSVLGSTAWLARALLWQAAAARALDAGEDAAETAAVARGLLADLGSPAGLARRLEDALPPL